MRRYKYFIFIIFFSIMPFFLSSQSESGSIWLTIDDPSPVPQSGGTFTTKFNFYTSHAVMGAYLMTVQYDPEILQILGITTPSASAFYDNTFADESAFTSGKVNITAFQAKNWTAQDTPTTFATIEWKAIGNPGVSTTIELSAKTIVDSFWQPVEVFNGSITTELTSFITPVSTPTTTYVPTPTVTSSPISFTTPTPTPTPAKTITSTPTLQPLPTPLSTGTLSPSICEVEKIALNKSNLKLKRKKSSNIIVSATGNNGCPVEGAIIKTRINKSGKKCVSISPKNVVTDAYGEATFTITTKKKTGKAKVTFNVENLRKRITVQVRK